MGKLFVELEGEEQDKYAKEHSFGRKLERDKYKKRPIKPKCEITFKLDGTIPFDALYYGFLSTMEVTGEETKIHKKDARKIEESWYASEVDTRWAEIQQKKAYQQDMASKLLQAIGISTKAINSSINDRIETKKYLDLIKDAENTKDPEKQKEARRIQKMLWLDNVDPKKGKSSIYSMASELQFYMLPDYFIKAESAEEISKDTTLSERYKNILIKKLTEFLEWRKYWKENIKLMEKIAIEQLKRDLSMIVLYKRQLRPALENIKRLEFGGGNPASMYADLGSDDGLDNLAQTPARITMVKISSGLNREAEQKKEVVPLLKKYWTFDIVGAEATGANDWFFQIKANGYLLTPWECCWQQQSIEDTSLKKEIDDYIAGVAGEEDIAGLKEVAKLAINLGLDFKIGEEKKEEPEEGGLRLLDRLFEGKIGKKENETEAEKKDGAKKKEDTSPLNTCLKTEKNLKITNANYDAEKVKLQAQWDTIMGVFKKKFNLP